MNTSISFQGDENVLKLWQGLYNSVNTLKIRVLCFKQVNYISIKLFFKKGICAFLIYFQMETLEVDSLIQCFVALLVNQVLSPVCTHIIKITASGEAFCKVSSKDFTVLQLKATSNPYFSRQVTLLSDPAAPTTLQP